MAITESTRTCSICGVTKAIDLFPTGRGRHRCKQCRTDHQRTISQQFRDRHRESERLRVRDKQRRLRAREGYQRPVERLKDKARESVSAAVRAGRLVKPETCSECGLPKRVYAHHHDYTKPLEVEWLCSGCHGLRHRT